MSPDEVTWITDKLAITNFFSAHNKEVLTQHAISAVLCLDRELEGGAAADRGVECIRVVHLVDGANDMRLFTLAVTELDELTRRYERVLVHCRAGRSRSVAVVAAYLKKSLNIDADEALNLVKSRRETAIAPELVRLVEQFEFGK